MMRIIDTMLNAFKVSFRHVSAQHIVEAKDKTVLIFVRTLFVENASNENKIGLLSFGISIALKKC